MAVESTTDAPRALGVNQTQGTSETEAKRAKSVKDKDTFLQLLVAQMNQQDPLKPMDASQMVTQLAQFTSVEQMIDQSAKLDVLSAQLTGIASNEAIGLIGQEVTFSGAQLTFDGASVTGASVNLSAPADNVTVNVIDENGKTVRSLVTKNVGSGPFAINWDGKDTGGNYVKPGAYSYEVAAFDKKGDVVGVDSTVSGIVQTVDFSKGFPEVTLESGASAPISDLVKVSKPKAAGFPISP
jgi:flagellar basal-body rod modification protein FlgD